MKWKNISKIYCITSNKYEPERYSYLNKMFEKIGIEKNRISYVCPTYNSTLTDEDMKKYVDKDYLTSVRKVPMKKSEISLILNYKAVLEDIVKNFNDGYFIIFESDVLVKNNINDFDDFLEKVIKLKDWDLIHFGGDESGLFKLPYVKTFYNQGKFNNKLLNFVKENSNGKKFIEDLTVEDSKYRLIRKFSTRCTDSFLWNFQGVKIFLEYLNNNKFNVPLDYFMTDFLEKNLNFKHYWSKDTYFIQGTNFGYYNSSIQNNKLRNKEEIIKNNNLMKID